MIKIDEKRNCCGCTACYNICPTKAIFMEKDEEGFLYPKVDMDKCVDCKLCEKVCPYINESRPQYDYEETFVAINKDEEIRAKSSSGGMFAIFAKRILEQKGMVFATAYDEEWLVYHKGIDNEKELANLIGSKYLQSNLGKTFKEVEKLLKDGVLVLFVGTTCQVNGLKNFLRVDYQNLITIDFICLGVPSPKVWKDYLNIFFKDYNIQNINFKDKSLGWHSFSLKISGKKKSFCKNGRETYYFTGYFRHLYTRPSCANCTYKLGNRMSDITISDCWGYDKIAPEMDDNKGMSSVICHTEKGINLFDECKTCLIWKRGELADVLEFNPGYRMSSDESEQREKFWKDYNTMSKEKVFKKYCTPERVSFYHRVKRKIKSLIKYNS